MDDELLARLDGACGLLIPEQLDRARAAQARRDPVPPLAAVLVELGFLTVEQAAALAAEGAARTVADTPTLRRPDGGAEAGPAPATADTATWVLPEAGRQAAAPVADPPAAGGTASDPATVPVGACGPAATSNDTAGATVLRGGDGASPAAAPGPTPPATTMTHVAPPAIGRRFGKYEVVRELGRGGMGIVYRAWRPDLGASFAVKVLLSGGDASAEEVDRFRREAQMAARLRHPGIVAVHDIGVEEGRTYFAMELVDGPILEQVLRDPVGAGVPSAPRPSAGTRRPGIQAAAAVRMVQEGAEAIQFAHAAGVIHRDLKPANVLRDRSGRLKVTDFGLARLVDTGAGRGTQTGTVLGTPSYMSPEQAIGRVRAVDAASDVYQLGAILYELLTGRPPYVGRNSREIVNRVVHEDPISPRRLDPGIDRHAEAICLKALAREKSARYASAAELAADGGLPGTSRPPAGSDAGLKATDPRASRLHEYLQADLAYLQARPGAPRTARTRKGCFPMPGATTIRPSRSIRPLPRRGWVGRDWARFGANASSHAARIRSRPLPRLCATWSRRSRSTRAPRRRDTGAVCCTPTWARRRRPWPTSRRTRT